MALSQSPPRNPALAELRLAHKAVSAFYISISLSGEQDHHLIAGASAFGAIRQDSGVSGRA